LQIGQAVTARTNSIQLSKERFIMASLMTQIVENTSTALDNPRDLKNGECAVVRNANETFFYCNNPEKVNFEDLADSGKYLTYNFIEKSSGQLYTWHVNTSGRSISSVILIQNHNAFPIKVSFTNIGLTNASAGSDKAAWESYYNGTKSESVEIPAQGYKSVLVQNNIPSGYVFGKIARFKITNKSGSPASAYFYDLAYAQSQNSGNAHSFAAGDDPRDEIPNSVARNSRRRGTGKGFYNYLTIGTSAKPVELSATKTARSATVGGVYAQDAVNGHSDSFNGDDMVIIQGTGTVSDTVSQNNDSGYLFGCYGMQMRVTMTIKNSTNQAREVRVFMGCKNTAVPIFARYNKAFYKFSNTVPKGKIRDVITLGTVAAGAVTTIEFDTVVLAQSAAPFHIGARLV